MSNIQIQASQENGQAREQQIEGHIGVLQGEIELVKDAKMQLQFKMDELRREMRELEQGYKNIKAQRDHLKAELEQLGFRVIFDISAEDSSKKHYLQE